MEAMIGPPPPLRTMTLTPDDLACLYVPTPTDPVLVEMVEGCGGTVIDADGGGTGWTRAEPDQVPPRPVVVAARRLPAPYLRELAGRVSVLGLWFEEVDEERMLALEDLEDDVTLLVPGRAFASGWRAGATGTIAPEFLAAPDAFVTWCAGFEGDLSHALESERRMQHALESRFEPLARRESWTAVERVYAFATAGGWNGSTLSLEHRDTLHAFGAALAEALTA
jgi:hypothetical protein